MTKHAIRPSDIADAIRREGASLAAEMMKRHPDLLKEKKGYIERKIRTIAGSVASAVERTLIGDDAAKEKSSAQGLTEVADLLALPRRLQLGNNAHLASSHAQKQLSALTRGVLELLLRNALYPDVPSMEAAEPHFTHHKSKKKRHGEPRRFDPLTLGLVADKMSVNRSPEERKAIERRSKELQSSLLLVEMLDAMERAAEEGDVFSRSWINEWFPDMVRRLRATVIDPSRRPAVDWRKIHGLLPPHLRDRFLVGRPGEVEQEAARQLLHWWPLIAAFNDHGLADDVLQAAGIESTRPGTRSRRTRALFGTSKSITTPPPGDFPEPRLDVDPTSPERVAHDSLLRAAYKHILKNSIGGPAPASTEESRTSMPDEVRAELLRHIAHLTPEIQARFLPLIDAVTATFREALHEPNPRGLRPVLSIKGKDCPWSLRQLLAAHSFCTDPSSEAFNKLGARRKLVTTPTRSGKSEMMIRTYMRTRTPKSKAIFVVPLGMVDTFRDRLLGCKRPGHERESVLTDEKLREGGGEPVGIIRSGMSRVQVIAALEREFVIVPYSMLDASPRCEQEASQSSSETRESVCDMIIRHEDPHGRQFSFVGVDEIQNARKAGKKSKGSRTKLVQRLVTQIPGIVEKGHVLFCSAYPTPGDLKATIAYLMALDPDRFQDIKKTASKVLRATPLELRNILLPYMFNVDGYQEWMSALTKRTFDLYPNERAQYEKIRSNIKHDPNHKRRIADKLIHNPWLMMKEFARTSITKDMRLDEETRAALLQRLSDPLMTAVHDARGWSVVPVLDLASSEMDMNATFHAHALTHYHAHYDCIPDYIRTVTTPHEKLDPEGHHLYVDRHSVEVAALLSERHGGRPVHVVVHGYENIGAEKRNRHLANLRRLADAVGEKYGCAIPVTVAGAESGAPALDIATDALPYHVYVITGNTSPHVREEGIERARQAAAQEIDGHAGTMSNGALPEKVFLFIQENTGLLEGREFTPVRSGGYRGFTWLPESIAQSFGRGRGYDGWNMGNLRITVTLAKDTHQESMFRDGEARVRDSKILQNGSEESEHSSLRAGPHEIISDILRKLKKARWRIIEEWWAGVLTEEQIHALRLSRLFNQGVDAFLDYADSPEGISAAQNYIEDFPKKHAATNARAEAGTTLRLESALAEGWEERMNRVNDFLRSRGLPALDVAARDAEQALDAILASDVGGIVRSMLQPPGIPNWTVTGLDIRLARHGFRRILDLGCGPNSFPWALGMVTKSRRRRTFDCLDISSTMLACGQALFKAHEIKHLPRAIQGSMTDIPQILGLPDPPLQSDLYDMVHSGLSIYYTRLKPKRKKILDAKGNIIDERIRTLYGMNRCTKQGGLLYISMPEHCCSPGELECFCREGLPLLGFRALDSYWGITESTDKGDDVFRSLTIVAQKIEDLGDGRILQERLGDGKARCLTFTKERTTKSSRGVHQKRQRWIPPEGMDPDVYHTKFCIHPISGGAMDPSGHHIEHGVESSRSLEREMLAELLKNLNKLLEDYDLIGNAAFIEFMRGKKPGDDTFNDFLIGVRSLGVRVQMGLVNRHGKPFFVLEESTDGISGPTDLLNPDGDLLSPFISTDAARAESKEYARRRS